MNDTFNKLVMKLRFKKIFDSIPGWIYYFFSSKIINLQASHSGRDLLAKVWIQSDLKKSHFLIKEGNMVYFQNESVSFFNIVTPYIFLYNGNTIVRCLNVWHFCALHKKSFLFTSNENVEITNIWKNGRLNLNIKG